MSPPVKSYHFLPVLPKPPSPRSVPDSSQTRRLLYASLEPNGAYTIQKIIERIPDRYRNEFNYIFISFVGFISKKKFGIVTVKKFISCTKTDTVTSQLMGLIRKNFMDFAEGQYANYLVQYLIPMIFILEWTQRKEL